MKPIIQAAIESGRPPLELLMDEPNRERTRLDGTLIKAYYLQKAYEIDGYPVWVEESPNVTFESKTRVIRSLAVVEAAQEAESKKKSPRAGKRFHAEAKLRPGASWPTRAEWMAGRSGGAEYAEDSTLVDRTREAEERAAALVAQNPEAAHIVAKFAERFKSTAGSMD